MTGCIGRSGPTRAGLGSNRGVLKPHATRRREKLVGGARPRTTTLLQESKSGARRLERPSGGWASRDRRSRTHLEKNHEGDS